MLTHSKLAVIGAAGLLLAASPALAVPSPILKPTDVLIFNSGSTNSLGYTIYISPQGVTQFAKIGGPVMSTETPYYGPYSGAGLKVQARAFFRDLASAGPLASLPVRHGMRSASFGTSTTIQYKHQQSPDLTNGSDPRVVALRNDVQAIAQTLRLGGPRRPLIRANH